MNKHPRTRDEATSAGEREQSLAAREEAVSNRETWLRVRETHTGEHEVLVHDREEAVTFLEEALQARAEAEAARLDRERLLGQMREANERLVIATLRAEALAEQADAARDVASGRAAAEAERRQRAEELAAQLRAGEAALRTSERIARESERAKDDFLAILGHELRNPLAAIRLALELIAAVRPDAHAREHAIIERQMTHLVRLVDELLDASRIRTGKIALQCRPIELADIVAHGVEMARPLITSLGHVLSVDVPRTGLVINADEARLVQVVSNLLTNAAKFTANGGAIVVTAERREQTVVLRVRDTGIGIAPALLPHIFDAYVQQETRGSERSPSGLGLGLAIVQSLVSMHGGTVTAHSEGLGRGSEFVIELPAIATSRIAAPTRAPAAGQGSAAKRNILVVEDNEDTAELMADVLSQLGHDVRVALDGASALALVEGFVPDFVLLDVGLPDMDGYEVAQSLRAKVPHHVAFIALTAYGQPLDRERSRQAEFVAHLVKPVDAATIQRTIEESSPAENANDHLH